MIPTISEQFLQSFTENTIPTKDYALSNDKERVNGFVDGIEAVKQAVFFILNTERYEHLIYSWDYGVELKDLIGMPPSYVIPEVERRVTEALTQDDRIESVSDFQFERQKEKLHVTFVVHTIYGDIESEVNVNV